MNSNDYSYLNGDNINIFWKCKVGRYTYAAAAVFKPIKLIKSNDYVIEVESRNNARQGSLMY